MAKMKLFFQEARQEFKRVNWPSFSETGRLTVVVIVMSLIMAVFLGVFDLVFLYGLDKLLFLRF